jgi:hypothetical protein
MWPSILLAAALVGASQDTVEIQTPLIEKYLPGYRARVQRHCPAAGENLILTERATGQSTALENEWSGSADERRYFRVRGISRFLRWRNLRVLDAQAAIELVQLTEDLTRSGCGSSLPPGAGREQWKYSAEKGRGRWTVGVRYIGPPACIMEPPTYEILTADDSRFVEIRWIERYLPPVKKQ